VIFNQPQTSHGCTGSQTVTVQNGDTLTVLVENHVSGSFSVEQVVNIVADTNGIANRNVIHANQQIRLPTSCNGP
jgi:LysM repeat protein